MQAGRKLGTCGFGKLVVICAAGQICRECRDDHGQSLRAGLASASYVLCCHHAKSHAKSHAKAKHGGLFGV